MNKPKKKVGAPYGNRNAFKHGFYSSCFFEEEIQRLSKDVRGGFVDESELLQVLLSRMASSLKKRQAQDITREEYTSMLRVAVQAVSRIESMQRTRLWLRVREVPRNARRA